jgi:hypothetical protein
MGAIVEQLGGIIVFYFAPAMAGDVSGCALQGRRVRFQLIVDPAGEYGRHSPIFSFGMS